MIEVGSDRTQMGASFFYKSPWLYEALMLGLYGGAYFERCKSLAALVPEGSRVVDVCCGPARLYFDYLRFQRVSYTGLDINPTFVARLTSARSASSATRSGSGSTATGIVWDVADSAPLPQGDYVIMQASLYHFLPDPRPVVDRMLAAAREKVILTEPVRNVADSKNPVLAWLARKFTNPGTGDQPSRFNEARFEKFLDQYRAAGRVIDSYPIAAGRERLCLLRPGC
jgi:SAM-dependent methyltransferase